MTASPANHGLIAKAIPGAEERDAVLRPGHRGPPAAAPSALRQAGAWHPKGPPAALQRSMRETYLDRVTKQQILDAVSEAVSGQAAENIATLKKAAMAARAEELFAGSGWLPEPLRTRSPAHG